ncbi:MAG: Omp28-related outer membrane protein [Bacteroidetes bacterium]|nr:Omp28-related outer membrane protein [Bacteroidota bacterium]
MGITAKSIIEDGMVKVNVGLKIHETDAYNIQIAVVEDNVTAYQDNSERIKLYDFKKHHHVLQYALFNDYLGKPLNSGKDLESYSYYAEHFEFEIPENIKKIENCRLVIYVLNGKHVTNSVEINIDGGVVPFEYEKAE